MDKSALKFTRAVVHRDGPKETPWRVKLTIDNVNFLVAAAFEDREWAQAWAIEKVIAMRKIPDAG